MKNNKMLIIIISLITIVSFIIGLSYAYFTTIVIGNDTASSNITTSGSLRLNFNGVDYINMENSVPGDNDTITFTVTNSGTVTINAYLVNFSNVINTFTVKSEMVYEIECVSSDAVTCSGKTETEIPSTSGVSITQTSIAPGTTHTYTLTVTFTDTGLLQDYNQNKLVTFKITIDEEFNISTLIAANYIGSPTWDTVGYFWDYKYDITSITFEDVIDVPVGAFASWDVSEAQDDSIMAYIIDDGLGMSTYELFIQTNGEFILANPNSSYLFYYFSEVTVINNISMLNTSYVTTMSEMFSNCRKLLSLDLSTFNTANVTNMYEMLYFCFDLASIDLSNFDTQNVTNMSLMFGGCYDLINLNLSSFDTSIVTLMNYMFGDCNSLINLDISSFSTSNVTNMQEMFSNCSSLTSLNLSTFNTVSVTNMSFMFRGCSGLTTIDIGMFNTNIVTNMSSMFSNCSGLTSLDIRNADFTTVTTYSNLFLGITNGITITVKDVTAQTWITSRLTDAGKTGTVNIY